jgi:hypothetical protein
MNTTSQSCKSLVGADSKPSGSTASCNGRWVRLALTPVAATAATLVFAAAIVFPATILANDEEVRTFTVDVATDAKTNAQNDIDPAEGQDVFTKGDTFVFEGTIYPGHTLPSGKAHNDPNAPGGIGKYRIRGTYTTDFANFERAVDELAGAAPDLAFATEMFSLLDDKTLLMTEGTWPNPHFSAHRVVLGGTGQFRNVIGEVREENIGENAGGFCNLRVTFILRKIR